MRRYVYGDKAEWYDTYPARPISAVIPVDAAIPGCPIDRDEFVGVVKRLLQGRAPATAGLPAVRRVQAQRECLPVPARQDLPRPDHPRRM